MALASGCNFRLVHMNTRPTAAEREHLARIKGMACAVCDQPGPSDAHHIDQHLPYLCLPLCRDCHQGGHNGIHGQRRIWNVLKKTEHTCLNDTIRELQK